MYFAEWIGRPELREAFFAGYGQQLDGPAIETLRCVGAALSVTGRLWAREHHNPTYEQHHIDTLRRLRRGDL